MANELQHQSVLILHEEWVIEILISGKVFRSQLLYYEVHANPYHVIRQSIYLEHLQDSLYQLCSLALMIVITLSIVIFAPLFLLYSD